MNPNFDKIKQFCDENSGRFIRGRRFILYDFAEALVKWCNNINNEMKTKEETKNRIIFKNCFLSTENPDPNSWIRSFFKDELMEKETEIAQRIAFNFGEFVGRTAKEEKMPVGKVLNTILECIERLTIKKK